MKETVALAPELPETESLEEVRAFLRGRLHFSAEQTRERYASYIARRLFPEGYADRALRAFARAFAGRQELRDACFYRFCTAERLLPKVVNDLLRPAVGAGTLERARLRDYLAAQFPESRDVSNTAMAIVEALTGAGIAQVDRLRLRFGYREVAPAALAFVIYGEFPEPGMYEIRALEENAVVRALLWNPDRLLPGLYELQEQGMLARVSEIDRVRQFTTRGWRDEVIPALAAEARL
jgi:DNA repair protein RadC